MLKKAIEILEAFAVAQEEARPIALIGVKGSGATMLARRFGMLRAPIRAPHHTASKAAIASELTLAAGGVLYFEETELFRVSHVAEMLRTWRQMGANPAAPVIVFSVPDEDRLVHVREIVGDVRPIIVRLDDE